MTETPDGVQQTRPVSLIQSIIHHFVHSDQIFVNLTFKMKFNDAKKNILHELKINKKTRNSAKTSQIHSFLSFVYNEA